MQSLAIPLYITVEARYKKKEQRIYSPRSYVGRWGILPL
jgi:hypothetical protein